MNALTLTDPAIALRSYNRDFSQRQQRIANARRSLKLQSRDLKRRGKGNRAWRRVDALNRQPDTILWPDYALR